MNETDRTITPTPNQQQSPVADCAVVDPPRNIGRYRVLKILGQGGFGLVYLAQDEQLERLVAIKVPHPRLIAETSDAQAYFSPEARTVANLDHPNIVPVHDIGSTDEFPCFVVSKYIDGPDLATRLKQSRLPIHESVALVATVAEALHHAHKQGLVHRDVKPSNILLDKTGKPFVADFGLVLREKDVGKGPHFAGTPAYMSPEQARGEGHLVDGRSDIFSLGVVLYELLVGRRPFKGDSAAELLEQVTTLEPRPLRQVDDQIPKELERICLKALTKKASERYTTARDMAEDLRNWISGPDGSRIPARVESALPELGAAPGVSKDAFISYSTPDQEAAFRLCRLLEEQGIGCWIAPRDVTPGADYGTAIIRAIETAAATVLLLSAHSNASIHVAHEVERAISKRKRVIPVRLEDVQPGPSLELHIATSHWLDAFRLSPEQVAAQLASALRGEALATPRFSATTPPVAPASGQPGKIVAKGLAPKEPRGEDSPKKRNPLHWLGAAAVVLFGVTLGCWLIFGRPSPSDGDKDKSDKKDGSLASTDGGKDKKDELAQPNPRLAPTFGSIQLKTGFLPDPHKIALLAGGPIKTTLDGVHAYVGKAPDYRLDYTAGAFPLTFYVKSKGDTTLLINQPDGTWIADDDSGGSFNPLIEIADPKSGIYDIYVGTAKKDEKNKEAVLYITERAVKADGGPAVLMEVGLPAVAARSADKKDESIKDLTITYSYQREKDRLQIGYRLPYLDRQRAGETVQGVRVDQAAFLWETPVLSVKVLNNSDRSVVLTECIAEITASEPDLEPVLLVCDRSRDALLIINEGWGDVVDPVLTFKILSLQKGKGKDADPAERRTLELKTFTNDVRVPLVKYVPKALEDDDAVAVTGVLEFGPAGQRKKMPFATTIVFEMPPGVPLPPTFQYDLGLTAGKAPETIRVPVSHSLKPGEADQFLLRVTSDKSAHYDIRLSIRMIDGDELPPQLIALDMFVPRTVAKKAEKAPKLSVGSIPTTP